MKNKIACSLMGLGLMLSACGNPPSSATSSLSASESTTAADEEAPSSSTSDSETITEEPVDTFSTEYVSDTGVNMIHSHRHLKSFYDYESLHSFVTGKFREQNTERLLMLNAEKMMEFHYHEFQLRYDEETDGRYANSAIYELFYIYDEELGSFKSEEIYGSVWSMHLRCLFFVTPSADGPIAFKIEPVAPRKAKVTIEEDGVIVGYIYAKMVTLAHIHYLEQYLNRNLSIA